MCIKVKSWFETKYLNDTFLMLKIIRYTQTFFKWAQVKLTLNM